MSDTLNINKAEEKLLPVKVRTQIGEMPNGNATILFELFQTPEVSREIQLALMRMDVINLDFAMKVAENIGRQLQTAIRTYRAQKLAEQAKPKIEVVESMPASLRNGR